ncbi:hypothetical protein BU15DRAFT_66091 [Melanogaster broomeanus]|nr:hypothetical protein BU15DRAFT_66091 [Melanogaster broomeanus]
MACVAFSMTESSLANFWQRIPFMLQACRLCSLQVPYNLIRITNGTSKPGYCLGSMMKRRADWSKVDGTSTSSRVGVLSSSLILGQFDPGWRDLLKGKGCTVGRTIALQEVTALMRPQRLDTDFVWAFNSSSTVYRTSYSAAATRTYVVHASSWFSSEPEYSKWSQHELCTWLENHNIRWTPTGPVPILSSHAEAGRQWSAYYSSIASASASSVYADATDTADSASQTVSDVAAQAVSGVTRVFDDSKDYVYSTWDDNRLRSWLEDHGIPSDAASRSSLIGEMERYYYNISDKVWNTWSDSELKTWLVEHGFLKSDARKQRDELVKMVEANPRHLDCVTGTITSQHLIVYGELGVTPTFASGSWSMDILTTGAEQRKSAYELVKLIHSKYTDASEKTASYLVWPDARLRAYLRERGVSESALPTSRPGLLQETRIRWVQAHTRAETIFAKLKEIVNSSVEVVEEKLSQVLKVLSGHWLFA